MSLSPPQTDRRVSRPVRPDHRRRSSDDERRDAAAPRDARSHAGRDRDHRGALPRPRRASVATRAMPGLLDRGVAPSPEDEIVTRERDLMVRDGLAALGGDDREIVVLAANGYRPEEIAGIIGCTGAAT